MRLNTDTLIFTAALTLVGTSAFADACDYRPSRLLGEDNSKAALGAAGGLGASGAIGSGVFGMYTLVNGGSGLTMLGSTMAGASGAGTVGIIAGTGGAVGAAGAVILNPFVWVPAAIVGVGGGGFEATCAFFVDERITDYADVLAVMRSFELTADPKYFMLVEGAMKPFIRLTDAEGTISNYNVEDLYIVDGMLKSRDFGPNTKIGRVVLLSNEAKKD